MDTEARIKASTRHLKSFRRSSARRTSRPSNPTHGTPSIRDDASQTRSYAARSETLSRGTHDSRTVRSRSEREPGTGDGASPAAVSMPGSSSAQLAHPIGVTLAAGHCIASTCGWRSRDGRICRGAPGASPLRDFASRVARAVEQAPEAGLDGVVGAPAPDSGVADRPPAQARSGGPPRGRLLAEGEDGVLDLAAAGATAIALAAGVILGQYLAQPLRREGQWLESRLSGPRLVGPLLRRPGSRRRRPPASPDRRRVDPTSMSTCARCPCGGLPPSWAPREARTPPLPTLPRIWRRHDTARSGNCEAPIDPRRRRGRTPRPIHDR